MTQRECYLNSIRTIDQMGEFVHGIRRKKGPLFGGKVHHPAVNRKTVAIEILPALRGALSHPTGASLPTIPITKMRWHLPVRMGERIDSRWAPVVQIIFCELASARCLSPWDPANGRREGS